MKKNYVFPDMTDEEMESLDSSKQPRYSWLSDSQKENTIELCKRFAPINEVPNEKIHKALEDTNPRVFQSHDGILVWENDFVNLTDNLGIKTGNPNNLTKMLSDIFFNNFFKS